MNQSVQKSEHVIDKTPKLNQVFKKNNDYKIENKIEDTLNDSKSKKTSNFIEILSVWKNERNSDLKLKKILSYWMLGILVIQVIFINYIIYKIGISKLKYDEWTIRIFLSSVFVEIAAVVKIIVESLFPKNGSKDMLDFIEKVYKKEDKE